MKIKSDYPVFCAKHKVIFENIKNELEPIKNELDKHAQYNHVDLLISKSRDTDFLPSADAYMIKASRNSEHGIQTLTILKNAGANRLYDGILEKTKIATKTVIDKSGLTPKEKITSIIRSLLL